MFVDSLYSRELLKLRENKEIGESLKRDLYHAAKKLPLKWSRKPAHRLLTLRAEIVSPIEVMLAFQPAFYFSHHSALYFHELTNQEPKSFYLTKETMGRVAIHTTDLNPIKLQHIFSKSPRATNNYFSYQSSKGYLLEKQDLGRIGVESTTLNLGGKSERTIHKTSIERTLIDSVINPQYSGGIKTVISAYSKANIDISKLYMCYEAYGPLYPYWQSIGLILQMAKGGTWGESWIELFPKPEMDFYLDRNFREGWSYNDVWKVHFPKGIF